MLTVRTPMVFAAGLALTAALSGCGGGDDLFASSSTKGSGGSGNGGSSSAGSPTGSGSGAGSSTGGSTTGSGGGSATCSPPCGENEHCEAATSTCVCNLGFVEMNGACVAAPPGDPSTHTQQQVCDAWAAGHIATELDPLIATGDMCDSGTLKPGVFVDVLARLNMYRWMSGLGPVTHDPALDAQAQKCANLEAFWVIGMGGSAHMPPMNIPCWTPEGANAAGNSNIAWGSQNAPKAIDQFMEDLDNELHMAHRRWLMNPDLDPTGIGYWKTGGLYGAASCVWTQSFNGTGPKPPWYSMPAPGFAVKKIAQWTWTFHGTIPGILDAGISVLRVDDNMPLAVNIQKLIQYYGPDAISWTPNGWTVEVGKTYRVTVSGLQGGDVVYDVKPIDCN